MERVDLGTCVCCLRIPLHFPTFGTPTLFLTYSCAEYESHDIIAYLRTVNNVPDSYNNGKLCADDSVSRQFSNKFHAFFKKVLLKGNVLGVVSHYFWKKECTPLQTRNRKRRKGKSCNNQLLLISLTSIF